MSPRETPFLPEVSPRPRRQCLFLSWLCDCRQVPPDRPFCCFGFFFLPSSPAVVTKRNMKIGSLPPSSYVMGWFCTLSFYLCNLAKVAVFLASLFLLFVNPFVSISVLFPHSPCISHFPPRFLPFFFCGAMALVRLHLSPTSLLFYYTRKQNKSPLAPLLQSSFPHENISIFSLRLPNKPLPFR